MDASGTWLVVGLGNPGPQYERTLHNLGFMVISLLGERNGIRVTRPEAKSLAGSGHIGGSDVVLAMPQTFMNLSGLAVKALAEKYAAEPSRILIVHDELDLPWTGLRIRPNGSAAGNHGIESVIKSLGTQDFPRVRLGINPGHPVKNGADFVLSPIRKAQTEELEELLGHAAAAVESIIAEGAAKAMTKFNRRARSVQQEGK